MNIKDNNNIVSEYEWELSNSNNDLERFINELNILLVNKEIKDKVVKQICLVLDEIITNTISYGYSDNNPHLITIKISILDGCVNTVVIDDGIPFDPTQQATPDVSLSLDERPLGGLGLHLVKSFIDTIYYQYENGHNILKLEKKLPSD